MGQRLGFLSLPSLFQLVNGRVSCPKDTSLLDKYNYLCQDKGTLNLRQELKIFTLFVEFSFLEFRR